MSLIVLDEQPPTTTSLQSIFSNFPISSWWPLQDAPTHSQSNYDSTSSKRESPLAVCFINQLTSVTNHHNLSLSLSLSLSLH
ncbi:hypothetical protein RJT34_20520 [Clitoria ternatea]|uniref:Uncharacterized protein n=1 Tax=Clitoria ternatea TaxID=43366 RepID=A0AAN9P521_CLITE